MADLYNLDTLEGDADRKNKLQVASLQKPAPVTAPVGNTTLEQTPTQVGAAAPTVARPVGPTGLDAFNQAMSTQNPFRQQTQSTITQQLTKAGEAARQAADVARSRADKDISVQQEQTRQAAIKRYGGAAQDQISNLQRLQGDKALVDRMDMEQGLQAQVAKSTAEERDLGVKNALGFDQNTIDAAKTGGQLAQGERGLQSQENIAEANIQSDTNINYARIGSSERMQRNEIRANELKGNLDRTFAALTGNQRVDADLVLEDFRARNEALRQQNGYLNQKDLNSQQNAFQLELQKRGFDQQTAERIASQAFELEKVRESAKLDKELEGFRAGLRNGVKEDGTPFSDKDTADYFRKLNHADNKEMEELKGVIERLNIGERGAVEKEIASFAQILRNGVDEKGKPLTDYAVTKMLKEQEQRIRNGVNPETGEPYTDHQVEAIIIGLQHTNNIAEIKEETTQLGLREIATATLRYGIDPTTGKPFTEDQMAKRMEQATLGINPETGAPFESKFEQDVFMEGVKTSNQMKIDAPSLKLEQDRLAQQNTQFLKQFGLDELKFSSQEKKDNFDKIMQTVALGMQVAGDNPKAMVPFQRMLSDALGDVVQENASPSQKEAYAKTTLLSNFGEINSVEEFFAEAKDLGMSESAARRFLQENTKNGMQLLSTGNGSGELVWNDNTSQTASITAAGGKDAVLNSLTSAKTYGEVVAQGRKAGLTDSEIKALLLDRTTGKGENYTKNVDALLDTGIYSGFKVPWKPDAYRGADKGTIQTTRTEAGDTVTTYNGRKIEDLSPVEKGEIAKSDSMFNTLVTEGKAIDGGTFTLPLRVGDVKETLNRLGVTQSGWKEESKGNNGYIKFTKPIFVRQNGTLYTVDSIISEVRPTTNMWGIRDDWRFTELWATDPNTGKRQILFDNKEDI